MLLKVPPRLDTFRLPAELQRIVPASQWNVALGIKSGSGVLRDSKQRLTISEECGDWIRIRSRTFSIRCEFGSLSPHSSNIFEDTNFKTPHYLKSCYLD